MPEGMEACLLRQSKNFNHQELQTHTFTRDHLVCRWDSEGKLVIEMDCGMCMYLDNKLCSMQLSDTSDDPNAPVLDFQPSRDHHKDHHKEHDSSGAPQVIYILHVFLIGKCTVCVYGCMCFLCVKSIELFVCTSLHKIIDYFLS